MDGTVRLSPGSSPTSSGNSGGSMDLVDQVTRLIFPSPHDESSLTGYNTGRSGHDLPSSGSTEPGNYHINDNIVTTSVFIVMVLIFIGVLLIACCKVLIGCTARNFLTTNRTNQANMIYAINGQIIGNTNGQSTTNQQSSQQNPQLPPPRPAGHQPPAYDELSVLSLPPVYQFELDKDSSSDKGDSSSSDEQVVVNIALQESLKHNNSSSSEENSEEDEAVTSSRGGVVIPVVEDVVVSSTQDETETSHV